MIRIKPKNDHAYPSELEVDELVDWLQKNEYEVYHHTEYGHLRSMSHDGALQKWVA
jgi:hypothetical protein